MTAWDGFCTSGAMLALLLAGFIFRGIRRGAEVDTLPRSRDEALDLSGQKWRER